MDDAGGLFESAPCGYLVVDPGGVVVRANAELLRLSGLSPHDIGARTLSSLFSVGGRILLETHLAPMLEHDGVVREIALDLVRPDGRRVPVLVNANTAGPAGDLRVVVMEARDRRRYEQDLLEATRAAEHAREQAAAMAQTLQQTLIPPHPPSIPHLGVAAAYRPAGDGREVGGDFYDVFQVGPGAWVVVLGDVSGKGIPAAIVTSFVRYTVRSLAAVHEHPAVILALLHDAMQEHATERYCTLVLARLVGGADGWDVRLSLAGHPPAIVRRRDGSTYQLGVPGNPVGLVVDPEFHTVDHRLDDETLTFYTDGVTEARSAAGMFGENRLLELVSRLPHEPTAITETIAATALAWQADVASDDIAVVTVAPI